MKTTKVILLFLFAAICGQSFAHQNAEITHASATKLEKRYIDPSSVRFDQKEIYVQLGQD